MLEAALRGLAWAAPAQAQPPSQPDSIFVLRNNDIGDLIIVTPIFEALRRRFPEARIVAGIGLWNRPVLWQNPYVDEIIPLQAPWHNKYVHPQGWARALRYILFHPEAASLAARRFSIGLDLLGSPAGSLLLMRGRVPFRIGVRGYAGGYSATQRHIVFDPDERVGHAALRLAGLLGATSLPENKPQLFLSRAESEEAEQLWEASKPGGACRRLLLAPGAGLPEKRWPVSQWLEVAHRLAEDLTWQAIIVGSPEDWLLTEQLRAAHRRARNLVLTLRQTLALVSRADTLLCHSSMILHAAAAWNIPTVALLGPMFPSPRRHARQWGHPNCTMLGEADPSQVIAALDRMSFDPSQGATELMSAG